jgi:hypothetical protein
MLENQEEVLDSQEEVQEQPAAENKAPEQNVDSPVSQDDEGTIKIDFTKLNKEEDAVQEQSADDSDAVIGEPQDSSNSEEVVEELREPEQEESTVLEEVTEEEVVEQVEELTEQVEQAIVQADAGVDLPENIQKVVDFMNDTGGSLEDYVKLNTDYSALNEAQLIKEYYETTKPHLDKEDIELLMEDFSYDEELDEPKEIRKAKIAFKEEAAKAKQHLEKLKNNYYEEIKAGSKLNPEQQKAVDVFNRYNKEQETVKKENEQQAKIFLQQTDTVFSENFKGFDYSVGDKRYRFKVKDTTEVKDTQSDINNFVKKFLNDKNEMIDAKGYHKSLFTAMNADAIANHFYEQGKADAMKSSIEKSKNVDMDPRGTHEKVTTANGWQIRAVPSSSVSGSKLKIKKR